MQRHQTPNCVAGWVQSVIGQHGSVVEGLWKPIKHTIVHNILIRLVCHGPFRLVGLEVYELIYWCLLAIVAPIAWADIVLTNVHENRQVMLDGPPCYPTSDYVTLASRVNEVFHERGN